MPTEPSPPDSAAPPNTSDARVGKLQPATPNEPLRAGHIDWIFFVVAASVCD